MPARMPYPTAAAFQPDTLSMRALRDAVQRCEGCPILRAENRDAMIDRLVADLRVVAQSFAA